MQEILLDALVHAVFYWPDLLNAIKIANPKWEKHKRNLKATYNSQIETKEEWGKKLHAWNTILKTQWRQMAMLLDSLLKHKEASMKKWHLKSTGGKGNLTHEDVEANFWAVIPLELQVQSYWLFPVPNSQEEFLK